MPRQRPTAPGLMTELEQARIGAGLTRAQLAEKAGVTRATLGNALASGHGTICTLEALAGVLGMEVHLAPKLTQRRHGYPAWQPCGTRSAARRHYARGEPIDALCQAAEYEYDRQRGKAGAA